ncbi:MAG: aldehyde dehydrogenase family protein, partial [Desulfobacterales bacterium]|nr:aldehyde dehydrogenase family protein [Desulfobacterales bacterium]
MNNACISIPLPHNEPVKQYAPGSPERAALEAELSRQMAGKLDIPLIIGGQAVHTPDRGTARCPHDHGHELAEFSLAGAAETQAAIQAALKAKPAWEAMDWTQRAAIFLKAAELISNKYSAQLNAATMLNQSKNPFQAEIDATCELADFLRFNVKFMEEIYSQQPQSEKGVWNRLEYRPLEGFVFALTPFNFTAIAGNLCTAPAMMGNTIVWKPASTAVVSGFHLMEIFKEAGLPDGVINFIPGRGREVGSAVLSHPDLAGVHFTGSTQVFQTLWQQMGNNIASYKSYPRIVGETGGKDYIFMHPSADADETAAAAVRGAFEYQGQKCSACSRLYVPASRWEEMETLIRNHLSDIQTGPVTEFGNLVNAVIDETAFDDIMGYIQRAEGSSEAE